MNFINSNVFKHHVKSFNDFCDIDSSNCYTLKNLISEALKIFNDCENNICGIKIKLKNENPIIKLPNFSDSNDITFQILISLSYKDKIKDLCLSANYPAINIESGLFVSKQDSWKNYYTPVLRLLRKPSLKFIDCNFNAAGLDFNNTKSAKQRNKQFFSFKIIPQIGPHITINFDIDVRKLFWRLDEKGLLAAKYKADIHDILTESNNDQNEKIFEESVDDTLFNYEEKLEKWYDIDLLTDEAQNHYKIISGADININFKLSDHLKNLLNKIFNISKKESDQFINKTDLKKIEKCFINTFENYIKYYKNEDENKLNPFSAFEEYLKYHLQGLLSEYDAVSVNEAFYSYSLKNWQDRLDIFFEKAKKDNNIDNISNLFEILWEKSFRIKNKIFMTSAFELIDTTNPLAQVAHQRKYSFIAADSSRAYKTESAAFLPKILRDNNVSTIGRFCPIETPESQKLGLTGHLTFDSEISVKNLQVLANTKNGYVDYETEESEFLKKYLKTTLNKVLFDYNMLLLKTGHENDFAINQIFTSMGYEKTFIEWKKSSECCYALKTDESLFSYSTLMIPFIQNTDAARALMGAKNMKSAVPLINSEKPIIESGFEKQIFSHDAYSVKKAPISGTINDIQRINEKLKINIIDRQKNKSVWVENIPEFYMNSAHTFTGFIPRVFKGDVINEGEPVATSSCYNFDEIMTPLCGRNLLVAYSPFKGYNFEDGIVVSQKLVDENILTSSHIIKFKKRYKKSGEIKLKDLEKICSYIKENYLYKEISKNEGPVILYHEPAGEEKNEIAVTNEKKYSSDTGDEYFCDLYYGKVVNVELIEINNIIGENIYELGIFFLQERPVEVGDKLMGRFGNKGVITKILPADEMPKLKDGTCVDVILNPNGVISRMNLGQIFETQFSPLVKFGFFEAQKNNSEKISIGNPFNTQSFVRQIIDSTDNFEKFIKKVLDNKEINSRFEYDNKLKVKLYKDSKHSELFFEKPVITGYQYFFKLNHLSEDKVHARSEGGYNISYQQPLKGKKFGGGQRLGEMEIWCLLALEADKTLNEALERYSQSKYKNDGERRKNNCCQEIAVSHAMTAWFKALGIFIRMNNDGKNFSYGLSLVKNFEQLKKLMIVDHDVICGQIDPKNFEDNYYCAVNFLLKNKNETINYTNAKKIQKELISQEYYKGFDYKKNGNSLYHRFGFIKFNSVIINPILADNLANTLKSIVKNASGEGISRWVNDIDNILKTNVSDYHLLKNDKEFWENRGSQKKLKEIFEALEEKLLPNDIKKAFELIDNCGMEFLLVPPVILRMEDCVKNALIELGKDKKGENFKILKFQNFLNKQYEKIITKVNEGKNNIYDEIRKLFFSDDVDSKGILSILATKDGLLRNKMLGRRIDFSGRAVIVPEPELKLGEIIISYKFAVKFFKKVMPKQGRRRSLKSQIEYINNWLKENQEYIIFNRQPSLHRFSMQAYRVAKVCDENVIKLHPLVCEGLGADFDGDTGALYYFDGKSIQAEIKKKLGIYNNLMHSFASGKTLLHYEQDFQLGDHLLLKFDNYFYKNKLLELFDMFKYGNEKHFINAVINDSSEGRYKDIDELSKVTGSKELPKPLNIINSILIRLVKEIFGRDDIYQRDCFYSKVLESVDLLKNMSLEAATLKGVSFGIGDLIELSDKYQKYLSGKNLLFDSAKKSFKNFIKLPELIDNGVALLINSGSRGNEEQIMQLIKTRGQMQSIRRDFPPLSSVSEVKTSLLQGHSVYEYFISAHGARCGLGQKKLLTPVCGHFTRTLVEALYDFKITEYDCKTSRFLNIGNEEIRKIFGGKVSEIINGNYEKGTELYNFIKYFLLYRFTKNDKIIVPDLLADKYENSVSISKCIEDIKNGEKIIVRSPLKCDSKKGICSKCYGYDITRGKLPEIGFRAGIVTGQTIGERGTQLAMKMFHGGGIYKKDTFGNAVDSLKQAFSKVKNDKKLKTNVELSFYEILSAVYKNYVVGQKLSVVNFDLLLKAMLGFDNKGQLVVKYSNLNAGCREERDFLARISYSGLAVQTKNQLWDMIKNNITEMEYTADECSEKSKILFSTI
ncbi:MAG: hypothetical protein QMC67_00085 [Candidatus Wallbacteria bacterium]